MVSDWTKYILISIFYVLLEGATAYQYCPPFWTQFHNEDGVFCYRFFGQKQTWHEAEKICAGFTGCEGRELAHLVSITSFNEEVFVTEYRQFMLGIFGMDEPGMWIGYNDLAIESEWKWTDPYIRTHDYTNWSARSPKKGKGRYDCAYQLVSRSGRSKWIDKKCQEQHSFMCKMGAL